MGCGIHTISRCRPLFRVYCSLPTAFFFGDPHLITLDGKRYTFNGLGEYVLWRSESEGFGFEIQGRTGLVHNSTATVLVAMAAGYYNITRGEPNRPCYILRKQQAYGGQREAISLNGKCSECEKPHR